MNKKEKYSSVLIERDGRYFANDTEIDKEEFLREVDTESVIILPDNNRESM